MGQRRLQEHLLRHHTRRREGGVNPLLSRRLLYLRPTPHPPFTSCISISVACLSMLTPLVCPLPSPAHQRKTCIPLSTQSERTEDCGECLCVSSQQGNNMGLFIIKVIL